MRATERREYSKEIKMDAVRLVLKGNWFLDMEDARQKIEDWRKEYNGLRLHYSLKGLAPIEFLALQQIGRIFNF
jgi:transposase InsO family protein